MISNINKFSKEVIMIKVANLYENNEEYIIYLIGRKEHNGKNTIYKELEIAISEGTNGDLIYIDLKYIKGYNPKILLGEFKEIGSCDILFTIEEELEENGVRTIIYSLDKEKILTIFDSSIYLLDKNYKVIYNDNYKVNIIDTVKNMNFTINIEDKYLKQIYNSDGSLKKKYIGQVLKFYEILAVRSSNNKIFDLLLRQKIVGEDINDIIGEIVSILRFDGNKFNEIDVKVYIMSSKNSRKEEFLDKKHDFSKVYFMESEYNPNLRVERAIEKEFSLDPNFDKLNYLYNSVRLNNSYKYQIIAYLEGPKFCSERGGTVIILEEKNKEYVITSKVKDIIPPIIVCENMSDGYNDLIVRSIKDDKTDFRILKYNGNSYPINPLNERRLKESDKVIGIAVISDDLFYRKGIEY